MSYSLLSNRLANSISNSVFMAMLLVASTMIVADYWVSSQLFNRQLEPWIKSIPTFTLPHLMDSDHFSIKNEIKYVKSTGVFKNFVIYGVRKDPVAYINKPSPDNESKLTPIMDSSHIVWGYYSFEINYWPIFNTFFMLVLLSSAFLGLFYFILRKSISKRVDSEFKPFYGFIDKLQYITEELDKLGTGRGETNTLLSKKENASYEEKIINETFSKLVTEIIRSRESLKQVIIESETRKTEAQLSKLAIQIAHDIRSPVAALQSIITVLNKLPIEQLNLIRGVSKRIEDIANSILNNAKQLANEAKLRECELTSLLSELIQEKRAEYHHLDSIEIVFSNSGIDSPIYALVDEHQMSRVLSNIINNSFEAIDGPGKIQVSISAINEKLVEISIADSGHGISDTLLKKLCNEKVQSEKKGGTGIGLLTAREAIEAWNGKLSITTKELEGTKVTIHLPISEAPKWHLDRIVFSPKQTIVIIDDDEEIHKVWSRLLSGFLAKIEVHYFFKSETFIEWLGRSGQPSNPLYFIDFHLSQSEANGIDIIKANGLETSSILVTSLYYDNQVRKSCTELGIKLLPKYKLTSIPMDFSRC